MKKNFITGVIIVIICFFLFLFSTYTNYENITFIHTENNSEKKILYQDTEYHEAFNFTATEEYGIKNENDIELGWYYSFPFGTQYYSETSENPVFIYSIGSYSSMYLRQDYDYSTDVFVVENTNAEIVWKDIFICEKTDLSLGKSIRVYLHSKQYPRIRTYFDLTYVENEWYILLSDSKTAWVASDEFINILFKNGII